MHYPVDSPDHRSLLHLVHAASGVDFTAYQTQTVVRRIEHRMGRSATGTLASYLALVEGDAAELGRLADALLIKTTAMFRDARAFAALRDTVLPALFSRRVREGATSVSAWVVGCSTGEEAYSLGMCLFEASERASPALEVVVLASDVDTGALERAARGVLSALAAARVPAPLATRFLVRDGAEHRIAPDLRRAVRFTRHNVLDPSCRAPRGSVFTTFDLVFCCNLLIYLESDARAAALQRLVEACEPGSVLALGEAERLPAAMGLRFRALAPPASIFGLA